MDRIVIIGNGFDKAHNLPTGYKDFMEYLKDSIVNNGIKCEKFKEYIHRTTIEGKEDPWISVKKIPNKNSFKFEVNPHSNSIYFKSLFEERNELGFWSDLESHYYEILLKNKESLEATRIVNEEFNHLKQLLFNYLIKEIEQEIGSDCKYSTDKGNSIFKMLRNGHNDFEFEKTFFVTFNYTTKILIQYFFWLRDNNGKEKYPIEPIHIHGDLANPSNPIIFGYGDENSKEYKELELIGNNELLKNFKTFQYLRSNKYGNVLGLLSESNEIYIQVIGHSCGLCDKALLRAIFQHENVKYIEPTYYNDETKYFENLYNISRIFDDNTLMREKIIPLNETFKIGN